MNIIKQTGLKIQNKLRVYGTWSQEWQFKLVSRICIVSMLGYLTICVEMDMTHLIVLSKPSTVVAFILVYCTVAYPQCDGHSTSISACGVWGERVNVQVSRRETHTHIHLEQVKVEILFCILKKKNYILYFKLTTFQNSHIQLFFQYFISLKYYFPIHFFFIIFPKSSASSIVPHQNLGNP